MKVWGVIATILLVAAIGYGGWLYMQNKTLKSDKNKAESDFAAYKTQSSAKVAAANKKLQVLSLFFSSSNTAGTASGMEINNQAHALIQEMNNATLSADWTAMQNTKSGDTSGTKMMQDLVSAATTDLK